MNNDDPTQPDILPDADAARANGTDATAPADLDRDFHNLLGAMVAVGAAVLLILIAAVKYYDVLVTAARQWGG